MKKKILEAGMLAAVVCCLSNGTARAQMKVETADAMKAVTTKTPPAYPPMAKQMKVTGKVELEVTISEAGAVENVKVLTGNALLTNAASMAVKQWKFNPFTDGGNPTRAVTVVSFDFKL